MASWRMIAIAVAIGPMFPFGFCPHDHKCKWPYNPNAPKTLSEMLNGLTALTHANPGDYATVLSGPNPHQMPLRKFDYAIVLAGNGRNVSPTLLGRPLRGRVKRLRDRVDCLVHLGVRCR